MTQGAPDRDAGMAIDWDVPIEMDDGLVLRADVFRPDDDGAYPAILAYGPYAKGLGFEQGYPDAWRAMVESHPEILEGSSNRFQAWEVVDPERWVPHGYVCVRIDARGWGRSPGRIDPWSPREARDLYGCIEWAGTRPWSTGKVGLLGISYYAINQWQVAALRPPHLAAMIPWEGFADFYRDMNYHGGIGSDMKLVWYRRTIGSVQHGLGERAARSSVTGELVAGPETLSDEELEANRIDFIGEIRAHPLDDAFHRARSAHLEDIVTPFLSAGNWGGSSLHLRGNVEGFVRAASTEKWLEIHGLEHWTEFYTDYGIALQRRFFDRFLKDMDNGWDEQPRVLLRVRHVDGTFVDRGEDAWPIERTSWTPRYLDAEHGRLTDAPVTAAGSASFAALDSDGVTFSTPPFERETEITGPVAAKLFVSSSTSDADLFLVLRVFDAEDREVVFQGAVDPHTPIGHGWLRLSHRKLDPARSLPYRPWHPHDEEQPLEPGEIVEADVEIWPTCIVVPPGYRVALTVRGRDYEYDGDEGPQLSHFRNSRMRGVGIYTHDDPLHRPPDVFGGTTTIFTGGDHPSSVVLPVVPPRAATDDGTSS
ncbi:MAG TPA: CocE/NonD family hydrolase [Actinomycetota bacterium]|nr:CocE/NonD family hydrolase [Actinomycetota bacterium]